MGKEDGVADSCPHDVSERRYRLMLAGGVEDTATDDVGQCEHGSESCGPRDQSGGRENPTQKSIES